MSVDARDNKILSIRQCNSFMDNLGFYEGRAKGDIGRIPFEPNSTSRERGEIINAILHGKGRGGF